MSGTELVQYMTEEFMKYIDKPKRERKAQRKARKRKKQDNQPLSNKWFGLLPVSIKLWKNKNN
ncbi:MULTISPECIES: YqzE family protein [Paraliobacillus]|uniref:YqzE family protein n=1 Tax=Paraliobacillus TaxID=200903 RepID=UPI000DD4923A|nr:MULTISPECIES: YqzE family protein [Paraliobacillus]